MGRAYGVAAALRRLALPGLAIAWLVVVGGGTAGARTLAAERAERFADYLFEEGDYERAWLEYQRAAFLLSATDTLSYKAGVALRLRGEGERAAKWLRRAGLEQHSAELGRAAVYQSCYAWLQSDLPDSAVLVAEQWRDGRSGPCDDVSYLCGTSRILACDWSGAHDDLKRVQSEGADPKMRSAAARLDSMAQGGDLPGRKHIGLACILSAAVPGLGRLYAGRPSDALSSFTTVVGMGWLAYRTFGREGSDSTEAWAYAAASGLFYLGEVYGSGKAAAGASQRALDRHKARVLRVFVEYHPTGVGLRGEFALPTSGR